MFFVDCVRGDVERLGIPYKDGQNVSCVPDLLIYGGCGSSLSYCGVVEVNRMVVHPSFKRHFSKPPNQGILLRAVQEDVASKMSSSEKKISEDAHFELAAKKTKFSENLQESSEPAAKKIKFCDNLEESVEVENYDSDHESGPSVSGITESLLSESQRELLRTFFGQLFGSVLALELHQPSENTMRMGIWSCGFSGYFLCIYC